VRKTSSILLCLTVTVLDLVLPHAALADTVAGKLAKAKADQAQAAADLQDAEHRLAELTGQYRKEQARLQAAVRDVLVSYEAKLALSAEVAAAQERLDQQATEAYEAGPGTAIELFLGARTPADFASVQEFEASIIDQQTEAVGRMQQLRTSLDAVATGLEQRQADLTASTQDLAQLADQVNAQLEAARQSARRANVKVRSLQKQQQALERAQAAVQASLAGLDSAKQGVDQSALLALLGPSQGRGCDIPPGLGLAGAQLFGLASWYGWDFAGQATSTGAIYDPRLFTAANKDLPLNSFLRVHYRDRCAIVLVNDRGPYGGGRSFDLSEAAAEYLGYQSAGVVPVTADLLASAQ